ncbi:hypothetical protein IJ818_02890 [bacterium]|nr:hypothetical protein [bacterium]
MKKKFTTVGNSWAMLFTKTMIQILEINPETEQVDIKFDNGKVIIQKEQI